VTNLSNNKVVVVKINDRLPKKSKRIIDLSKAAATELDFIRQGLTQVEIEVLE
jgi:rare lipoprotein A